MAAALALPFPGVRVAATPAARAPARSPRPHLRIIAARTPPRPVSVRCAPNTGGNLADAPGPVDVHAPAVDALMGAAVDAFRPLMDNFVHVASLKNVMDLNDYNFGMPLGVAMASIGCYQLFKMNPWTFLDVVLGYAFYKLSVLSSQVDRQGFANELITHIKAAIVIIVLIKDFPNKKLNAFSIIRLHIFYLYTVTSYFAKIGWKHHSKQDLTALFEILRTKEGRREFVRHLITWQADGE